MQRLSRLLEAAADSISNIEINARPVVPPGYQEKPLQEITDIQDKKREKREGSEIGLVPNPDMDVETARKNILAVYGLLDEPEKDFWANWYERAQRDVQALASDLQVPFPLMAAVTAILSPGNKWGSNLRAAARAVQLAEKVMGSPDRQEIERTVEALKAEQASIKIKLQQLNQQVRKDPSVQPKIDELKGRLLQIFDHGKGLLPDQIKRYGDLARKHQHLISGYPANIRKAIFVIESEDPSKWVTGPKVSRFYEAIVNPKKLESEMVLDGHAVNIAAGIRQSLKLAGPTEGPRRERMLEAYAKAADDIKISTRSLQACTWAAFQSLRITKGDA
jgi:hypothetical protein